MKQHWKIYASRTLLTLVAVWGLFVMLSIYEKGLFLTSPLPPNRSDPRATLADHLEDSVRDSSRLGLRYPAFPSRRRVQSNPMKMNGVMVSSEKFETTSSPQAILDFYIDQMTARGWRDVTAEQHGRTSKSMMTLESLGAASQQQTTMGILDSVSNSELILQSARHMMHVKTKRGKSAWLTEAVIVVSKTNSPEEMAGLLNAGIREKLPRKGNMRFMDVTEYGSKNTYRTQQFVSHDEPEDVFTEMMEELKEEGWVAAAPIMSVGGEEEYFGTFTKEQHYAVLSVSEYKEIKGAMASLSVTQ